MVDVWLVENHIEHTCVHNVHCTIDVDTNFCCYYFTVHTPAVVVRFFSLHLFIVQCKYVLHAISTSRVSYEPKTARIGRRNEKSGTYDECIYHSDNSNWN